MTHKEFYSELVEKFPLMYSCRDVSVGAGWYKIILSLSRNIQRHIDQRKESIKWCKKNDKPVPDEIEQVVVVQIKEKFGGLRFYYGGGDDCIGGMVRMAESWAGEQRDTQWLKVLCADHYEERMTPR